MMKPEFTPEINLGHVLTIVTLILTVGGGAITSYVSLKSDIADVRSVQANHAARILNLENGRANEQAFENHIQDTLQQIFGTLGEIKAFLRKDDKTK